MQNESLFAEYVKKWFKAIAGIIKETFNGKKNAPTYLSDSMLTEEYSPDLKWDSASLSNTIVAADVVAMDSTLPLKKRPSMNRAAGTIPKLGMKMYKSEKLISDINIMKAKGVKESEIAAKIFADTERCAKGVKERIEGMFLQGLSTGQFLVEDETNTGVGIRVSYGFLDKNKFGVKVKWGEDGATPLSDIANVIAKAEESSFTTLMLSKRTYNELRLSEESKLLSANFRGLIVTENAKLPIPSPSQFNEAFKDEYGLTFLIVDRNIKFEKNGKQKNVKPFVDDVVIFLTTTQVGRVVYGTLAEETNPVAGVSYQKFGSYTLLSKYSKTDPLREYTCSQALALPVIDNVEDIYVLNTQEAQPLDDTDNPDKGGKDDDANITIYEQSLVKTDVIDALNKIGVKTNATIGDAKLLEKINGLSDADEEALKTELGI